MKVLKFGGTSVGSVNSILSVKKIVEAIEEPVIVVVSALGGITDKLLATSTMASKGDLAYEKELSEIIARHLDDRGSDRGQGGTHGCPEESDGFTG